VTWHPVRSTRPELPQPLQQHREVRAQARSYEKVAASIPAVVTNALGLVANAVNLWQVFATRTPLAVLCPWQFFRPLALGQTDTR
jgi:hypothetical protein